MTAGVIRARRWLLVGATSAVVAGALGLASRAWLAASEGPGDRPFPSWVYGSPRSAAAYEAAFARLDLMATLPCYCGCAGFDQPHRDLRDCFIRPNGDVEPHAAFCEICQGEALDASRWADEGASWDEIHRRIVAEYGNQEPPASGT